ncbi:MAG: HEAT repeat domain-containing protein, partial [Methanobacterium sp.]
VNTLNDENFFVRVNATNALAIIGNESVIPYLESALRNSKGESKDFEDSLKNAIEKIKARSQ